MSCDRAGSESLQFPSRELLSKLGDRIRFTAVRGADGTARTLVRLVKGYEANVESGPADDGRVKYVISSEVPDRVGDVILADGWEFKNYLRNPQFLFDHQYGEVAGSPPSQGRTTEISVRRSGDVKLTEAVVEFHRKTKFNEELYQIVRGGYMPGASVGFWPLEEPKARDPEADCCGGGFVFPRSELLEFSSVAVPMHQDALQTALSKGIVSRESAEMFARRNGIALKQQDRRQARDLPGMAEHAVRGVVLAKARQIRRVYARTAGA